MEPRLCGEGRKQLERHQPLWHVVHLCARSAAKDRARAEHGEKHTRTRDAGNRWKRALPSCTGGRVNSLPGHPHLLPLATDPALQPLTAAASSASKSVKLYRRPIIASSAASPLLSPPPASAVAPAEAGSFRSKRRYTASSKQMSQMDRTRGCAARGVSLRRGKRREGDAT